MRYMCNALPVLTLKLPTVNVFLYLPDFVPINKVEEEKRINLRKQLL